MGGGHGGCGWGGCGGASPASYEPVTPHCPLERRERKKILRMGLLLYQLIWLS